MASRFNHGRQPENSHAIRRDILAGLADPTDVPDAAGAAQAWLVVLARARRLLRRNLLGLARAMFNWAIEAGDFGLEISPCDRIRPRHLAPSRPQSRRKVMSILFLARRKPGKDTGKPEPIRGQSQLTAEGRKPTRNRSRSGPVPKASAQHGRAE